METLPNVIQSQTDLRSLTPLSQPRRSDLDSLERLKSARQWAGKVLNSYPDYGKAPPSYTASIVEIFAAYPVHIQEALADKKSGVVAKCEYLPTVAAIVKLAEELEQQHERREAIKAKPKRYAEPLPPPSTYCPYPQLWRAFHASPELLDAPYEILDRACKVLVLQGKQAAENVLKASKSKPQHSQAAA